MSTELVVVKVEGKTYVGKSGQSDGLASVTLIDACELITSLTVSSRGMNKHVVLTGIDYCTTPMSTILIQNPSIIYGSKNMGREEWTKLKTDYEDFCMESNIVKVPKSPLNIQ